MTVLAELQPASFRGAKFLVKSATTSGGRNTAVHEFVNRDERYVEDLGESKEIFKITAIISGADYFKKRDALLGAIKKEGAGTLVHPFYGTKQVFALPYSINESDASLGKAPVTLTFLEDTGPAEPVSVGAAASGISALAAAVYAAGNFRITNEYSIASGLVANIEAATDLVDGVANSVQEATQPFTQFAQSAVNLQNSIDRLKVNLGSYIQTASTLGGLITDIHSEAASSVEDPNEQLVAQLNLFDTPLPEQTFAVDTASRQERFNNQEALVVSSQSNALAGGFAASALASFNTADDVTSLIGVLESGYQSLLDRFSEGQRLAFAALRLETLKYLYSQKTTAPKVVSVRTAETSMTLLGYLYYDNTDQTENLIALNRPNNATFIEGAVNIVSAG